MCARLLKVPKSRWGKVFFAPRCIIRRMNATLMQNLSPSIQTNKGKDLDELDIYFSYQGKHLGEGVK